MANYNPLQAGICETIGTFFLTLFTAINTDISKSPNLFKQQLKVNALVTFAVLMFLMWICHKHSGSQFNPIFTVGMLITGELAPSILVSNLVGQLSGAVLGNVAYMFLVVNDNSYYNYNTQGSFMVLFIEFLMSLVLSLVFFLTSVNKQADRAVYGFVVPAFYAALILSIGKVYFTRFNSIIFLINSLFSMNFGSNFIFVLAGNIGGGLCGAIIYKSIFKSSLDKESMKPLTEDDSDIKF